MAFFCVSYDLVADKDYDALIDRIKKYDSVKVQLSFWLISVASTSSAIKDDLAAYMDNDDKLMVIEFAKRPQFTKALKGTNAWLDAHF